MRLCTLVAAAALLASSLVAHAATIDFNGLTGANGSAFTSYTEDGFLVTNSAGQYLVGQVFGNPVPSLFSGSDNSYLGPATNSASVTITAVDGGEFTFSSADLANDLDVGSYSFAGDLDGSLVYSQSGSLSTAPGIFETEDSTSPTVELTSLTITESGDDFNVDNIVVDETAAVTPEPASFVLLGTGLLGIAGVMRRRLA